MLAATGRRKHALLELISSLRRAQVPAQLFTRQETLGGCDAPKDVQVLPSRSISHHGIPLLDRLTTATPFSLDIFPFPAGFPANSSEMYVALSTCFPWEGMRC